MGHIRVPGVIVESPSTHRVDPTNARLRNDPAQQPGPPLGATHSRKVTRQAGSAAAEWFDLPICDVRSRCPDCRHISVRTRSRGG